MMKKKRNWLYLALCLLFGILFCVACGGKQQTETTTAAKAESGSQAAESTAAAEEGLSADSRVVALSRSVGEMWLLAGGNLVGVTDDAMDLEGLSKACTSVGKLSAPSAEAILALHPALVLTAPDIPAQREVQKTLEAAGVRCQAVDINNFADYASVMQSFTAETGRADLYEKNVTAVQQKIDSVKAALPSEIKGKTFLVIRASAAKTKVLKSDHFTVAMLEDLGLTNAAPESLLDQLSMEGITEANPDYLFVIFQGEPKEAEAVYQELIGGQPAYDQLKAVKDGHTAVLPKDLFQYKPNARWGEAYEKLAELLGGTAAKQ